MEKQLGFYDLIAVLVPGVLVVSIMLLLFPATSQYMAALDVPDAFAVLGLTAGGLYVGTIVQAMASLLSPLMDMVWGGRPSEAALTEGLGARYFGKNDGQRIAEKLKTTQKSAINSQSLFLIATQIAGRVPASRIDRFNALYGYHRSLVVVAILAFIAFSGSFWGGLAAGLSWRGVLIAYLILLGVLAILLYRTYQRGIYYVREVLLVAERQLDLDHDSTKET